MAVQLTPLDQPVTREEATWESFSEDEPALAKSKPSSSNAPSSMASRPKKSSGKPGQGNITNFFTKK